MGMSCKLPCSFTRPRVSAVLSCNACVILLFLNQLVNMFEYPDIATRVVRVQYILTFTILSRYGGLHRGDTT